MYPIKHPIRTAAEYNRLREEYLSLFEREVKGQHLLPEEADRMALLRLLLAAYISHAKEEDERWSVEVLRSLEEWKQPDDGLLQPFS